MRFIEKDQIKTSKKEKKAKKAQKECNEQAEKNKTLDININNVRSEISKQKDMLSGLEDHKEFIIELSKIQNANYVMQQQRMKD